MANKARIYMDACCFIDLAKSKIGKQSYNRKDDVWHIHQLLKAAQSNEIMVFSSILSVAECSHAEGSCDDKVKDLFNSILTSGRVVTLSQCTIFTAEKARNLLWKSHIKLRGADAIHVASALESRCEEFITSDRKGMLKQAEKIAKLGLQVVPAQDTTHLPRSYRQTALSI